MSLNAVACKEEAEAAERQAKGEAKGGRCRAVRLVASVEQQDEEESREETEQRETKAALQGEHGPRQSTSGHSHCQNFVMIL